MSIIITQTRNKPLTNCYQAKTEPFGHKHYPTNLVNCHKEWVKIEQKKIQGENTIFFIPHSHVPADAKVIYANLICDVRPLKNETHRVRMNVGGDKLECDGNPSSPAVSLLNTKICFNSVISDAHKGATFATADIKNHYLQSLMKNYQYMILSLKYFTQEIRDEDEIINIVDNNYVYIEIRKGMYGLKEAGILAFNYVVKNLAPHGYHPVQYTAGLEYFMRAIGECG